MSGSVHWRKTRGKPQERKVVGVLECRRALRKKTSGGKQDFCRVPLRNPCLNVVVIVRTLSLDLP